MSQPNQNHPTRRAVLQTAGALALMPLVGCLERAAVERRQPMHLEKANVFDVILVGGSFAGLSAALQLGRARRSVLVIDDEKPRNRFANHAHGFLTNDGRSPKDILSTARMQLEKYPTVQFLRDRATAAEKMNGQFSVQTSAGRHEARRVILAYGMRDILPEVEGIAALWGKSVFHCPYCHGYEFGGRPLAILGNGSSIRHGAVLLPEWSNDIILFTNGPATFDEPERARLIARKVKIEETPIRRLAPDGDDRIVIEFSDGRSVVRAGMLTPTRTDPVSELHSQLGCEVEDDDRGTFIRTDDMKLTSVPGIYAAGDLTRIGGSIAMAVSDGAVAGARSHQSIVAEDWG